MDILLEAGIGVSGALSLQTTDEDTLDAIDRSNISTELFVELGAQFRRRGHPVLGELMIGLPGQSYESFRKDLQFLVDLEVQARTWPVQVLPNAPMNDPEYRKRWEIETDPTSVVTSSSTFGDAERLRMLRLRHVEVTAERFGLLRHVMRLLQWDYGIPATTLMDRLASAAMHAPGRYPMLSWVIGYFDRFPTVPVGWKSFYGEVRRFVAEEFGIEGSSDLDCVLELQAFLMPSPERRFPSTISLAHDYVTYYRSAVDSLFETGHPGEPDKQLRKYGSAEFTIDGDPLELCTKGIWVDGDTQDQVMQGDFYNGGSNSNELESPLLRMLVPVATAGMKAPYLGARSPTQPSARSGPGVRPTPVALSTRPQT